MGQQFSQGNSREPAALARKILALQQAPKKPLLRRAVIFDRTTTQRRQIRTARMMGGENVPSLLIRIKNQLVVSWRIAGDVSMTRAIARKSIVHHEVLPETSAICFGGRAGTPCNMPWALMSSSMSGQCTPSPVPITSKCRRCSGVAFDRRHDQARGTPTVRPSASCAVMKSSVTSIATIRGSLLATMLIP